MNTIHEDELCCGDCGVPLETFPFCPVTGDPHELPEDFLDEEETEVQLTYCGLCGKDMSSVPFCGATGEKHCNMITRGAHAQLSPATSSTATGGHKSPPQPGSRKKTPVIRDSRGRRVIQSRDTKATSSRPNGVSRDTPMHVKEFAARRKKRSSGEGTGTVNAAANPDRRGTTEVDPTEDILGGESGFGIFLFDNPAVKTGAQAEQEKQRAKLLSTTTGVAKETVQSMRDEAQEEVLKEMLQEYGGAGMTNKFGTASRSARRTTSPLLQNGASHSQLHSSPSKRGLPKAEAIKQFQSLIDNKGRGGRGQQPPLPSDTARSRNTRYSGGTSPLGEHPAPDLHDLLGNVSRNNSNKDRPTSHQDLLDRQKKGLENEKQDAGKTGGGGGRTQRSIPYRIIDAIFGGSRFSPSMALLVVLVLMWNLRRVVKMLLFHSSDDDVLASPFATGGSSVAAVQGTPIDEADALHRLWTEDT